MLSIALNYTETERRKGIMSTELTQHLKQVFFRHTTMHLLTIPSLQSRYHLMTLDIPAGTTASPVKARNRSGPLHHPLWNSRNKTQGMDMNLSTINIKRLNTCVLVSQAENVPHLGWVTDGDVITGVVANQTQERIFPVQSHLLKTLLLGVQHCECDHESRRVFKIVTCKVSSHFKSAGCNAVVNIRKTTGVRRASITCLPKHRSSFFLTRYTCPFHQLS